MRFSDTENNIDLLHRCVLVRNSKYGVVAENNDELEYY